MTGRKLKIAVLRGDGIGPEIVEAAKNVLLAAAEVNSLPLELVDLPIGFEAYKKQGRTLPPETISGIEECSGWILGPLSAGAYPKDDPDSPMNSGKIRKKYDLYANIRPIRSLTTPNKNIDLVIVRENTEDFYPDRNLFKGNGEFWPNEDTVMSLRVISRKACRRIAETAFALAQKRAKKRVIAVHKANVLIEGDGLFLEEIRKIATNYPQVDLAEGLVDSVAMQLVMAPQSFDVLVTTNLFGDILSDVAAGTVGGLGLAPSLNAGEKYAMAQAVHGSAPDIAEKKIANPTAEILSTSMLLNWLYSKTGDQNIQKTYELIDRVVEELLRGADRKLLTADQGGQASTEKFGQTLVDRIRKQSA
jgi:3-isopropylmalate dehydrogenase